MRFTYEGERVPDFILITVYEGWRAAQSIALRFEGNLYNYPFRRRFGYRIGWLFSRLLHGFPAPRGAG